MMKSYKTQLTRREYLKITQFLGRETTWQTIAAKRSPNLSVLTTTQVGYKSRYRFSAQRGL